SSSSNGSNGCTERSLRSAEECRRASARAVAGHSLEEAQLALCQAYDDLLRHGVDGRGLRCVLLRPGYGDNIQQIRRQVREYATMMLSENVQLITGDQEMTTPQNSPHTETCGGCSQCLRPQLDI